MAFRTKIRKVGGSLWFSVPRDIADELGLSEGDEVRLVPTPDGLLLTLSGSDLSTVMDASQGFMRRYPDAMRKLAE